MTKAYSYQRFSTTEQEKGDSLRRQKSGAADYAALHGLDLDTTLTFRDLGVSGYTGKNQKAALGDFLKAVQSGLVPAGSVLIVEALDRLSRQDPMLVVLQVVGPLLTAGIDIVTLFPSPKRYTYDPAQSSNMLQLMEIVVLAGAAHDESARKSSRGRANWQQKRATAPTKPLTAKIPAWCQMVWGADGKREKIELIPDRAEIIKNIFADYLNGVGQVTIAKRLNMAGVPCWGRASMWYTSYISKILSSPSVVGIYEAHTLVGGKGGERIKQEVIRGYFPVIISESDYNKVQSMRQFGCFAGQRQEVHNVLSNLAKCPLCGSTMRRVRNGARARAKLICTKAKAGAGCIGYSVDYQRLETALLSGITTLTIKVPAVTKQQTAIADLQATIDRHKTILNNIMQAIQSGQVQPDSDIFSGREAVPVSMLQAVQLSESKIDEGEKELARLQHNLALVRGDSVRDRLKALKMLAVATDIDRGNINAVLHELCSKVVVDYLAAELQLAFRFGAVHAIPMESLSTDKLYELGTKLTGQMDCKDTI